jgi:hypothetical protein
MTLRNFLKPTAAKIIVFAILFFLASCFFMKYRLIVYLNFFYFIIDIVIGYFISCILVFLYSIMHYGVKDHHEMKKRKK